MSLHKRETHEIVRPAESRDVDPDARYFTPHSHPLDIALRRYNELPVEMQPSLREIEKSNGCASRGYPLSAHFQTLGPSPH
jgi:hypothetical protein